MDATGAGKRSPAGRGSSTSARASSSGDLLGLILQLVKGLKEQTRAIHRLAASNEALVQAMAEADPDGDGEPAFDMAGRPLG